MKKFFTLLIVLFITLENVFSDPVDKDEAKKIAEYFFNTYAPAMKKEAAINDVFVKKYNNQESLYIFTFETGGFVIVSADDHALPVLAYSFTSPVVEKLPANAESLLNRYSKEIEDLKKSEIKDDKIAKEWENIRNNRLKSDIKGAYLLTTIWNQEPYYNRYCPTGTPVGCVATAMSQIMNYHEWPETGNGWHKFIPSQNPSYGEQYADFGGTTYDWSNMPDELTGSSSEAEKTAVGTLCYHAGIAVNMDYSPDGSGAMSKDVLYALTSYFKYDPQTIQIHEYVAANSDAWISTIKEEIDNNRPVYYSGSSMADGGHAWLCDGYDASNKVHINWGWGGYLNGYFEVSAMNPSTSNFSEQNSMITGITPGQADQDLLWTKQASGFQNSSRGIRYISAVNENIAWAIAYDGAGDNDKVKEYTRTIDGGANWTPGEIYTMNLDNYSPSMITAVDANTAWVALFDGTNGGGKIVKTSDGGENWAIQSTATFSSPNGFPNVVHFWDENNGWCQGDPNGGYFELYTTTDGGENWTRVPQANIPTNSDGEYGTVGYYCVYGDIVWFATNKGRIFKSTDKGNNWVAYQTPLTDASFVLSFKDENTGIIQRRGEGDNKVQYITTNGGQSWTELNPTGNFYTTDFTYVPGTDTLISVGVDYNTPFMGLSYSVDNGTTFTEYAELYQNFQFTEVGAAGKNAIWAGGFNSDQYTDGMWHYGITPATVWVETTNTMYCNGDDATLTANKYGTVDAWSWNFGEGATPQTATGIGPHEVTYNTGGYKDITITVTQGSEEFTHIFDDYLLYSSAVPDDASAITGDTEVVAGEIHTYSVTNQSDVIFSWEIPTPWTGSSTINEVEIEFSGASGTNTITVTPSNGCGNGNSSSLEITASSSTGIEKVEKNKLKVYPNPASSYIKIDNIENTVVNIYSISGALCKSEYISTNRSIDISDLPNGIYQIKANIDDKIYSQTINIVK